MRALTAVSLAYFGSTAEGNTALPTAAGAAGAAAGFGVRAGLVSATGGGAAGAAAGCRCGIGSALGLAEIIPLLAVSVPAVLAAWYFALHSCMRQGLRRRCRRERGKTRHRNRTQ